MCCHIAYTSSNKTKIIWIETDFFFFTQGGCVSYLRAYLGAGLLPQSYQYPNLSEGADCIGGHLCRDEECPFSDVTKSGSLEEGAGKWCWECGWWAVCLLGPDEMKKQLSCVQLVCGQQSWKKTHSVEKYDAGTNLRCIIFSFCVHRLPTHFGLGYPSPLCSEKLI